MIDLRCGDCLEVLPTLAANSVDAIVTDPPYFKVKNEAWDRQWDTPGEFLGWLDKILVEFQRVLKPNGSLYLFASSKMAARVEVLISERFNVLNQIVWAKHDGYGNGMHSRQHKDDCRSWFPQTERIIFAEHYGADSYAKGEAGYVIQCDRLHGFVFESLRAYLDGERQRAGVNFEQVREIVGCAPGSGLPSHWFTRSQWMLPTADNYVKLREGFSHLNHGGQYLRREYEDLRREYEDLRRPFSVTADVPYTDVWSFATVASYPGKHPCEKPAALLEHIITASSRPGAVVLDAFMGSGSTGIAAQKSGRSFVGIEIDERWFRRSEQRIGAVQPVLVGS